MYLVGNQLLGPTLLLWRQMFFQSVGHFEICLKNLEYRNIFVNMICYFSKLNCFQKYTFFSINNGKTYVLSPINKSKL